LEKSALDVASKIEMARSEAGNHALQFLELLNPVKDQLTLHADLDLRALRDLVS